MERRHESLYQLEMSGCASLLERLEKVVPGNWSAARGWVDTQLNRIWRLRGAFPGLGSALTAFGLTHGTLVAHAIGQQLHADGSQEVRDPWPLVEKVLHEPNMLTPDLAATIGSTAAKLWGSLKPERRALLKLLARFEITADQASRWFVAEERKRAGITASDAEILANPYPCFEDDRGRIDPISASVVDRGLFPEATVAASVPIPDPSRCSEAIDPRRGRALLINTLDRAATEGHTLLPQSWLVQRVRDLDISPQCAIGADWIDAFDPFLKARLVIAKMADGTPAWQLQKFSQARDIISARVKRRLNEEQIIAILKQQESGMATSDVCRGHGISSATFYKWKAKFGGLEVSDARRLKALENENAPTTADPKPPLS